MNTWVQRIAPNPDTNRQINAASPEIWYDSLSQLADRLQASPQDRELRDRWQRLLEGIQAGDLAEEPIVGLVRITE